MKKILLKLAIFCIKKLANKFSCDLNNNNKNDLLEIVDKLEAELNSMKGDK